MIVEERNYLLVPGGVAQYLDHWQRDGREPQVRHLGEPLGLYTVEVGELNTLVYLWQYTDFGDRANRRERLAKDPDFAVFRGQVRSLLVNQTTRILASVARTESLSPQ